MLGSRVLRISAAAFVIAAIVALMWPQVTGYVSTYAVVNAPVHTIRAPVNGTIVRPSPALAAPVTRDQTLLDLKASRESRAEITRLRARIRSQSTHIDGLEAEADVQRALLTELAARAAVEREADLAYLARRLDGARARLRQSEVLLEDARADLAVLESLGNNVAAEQRVEDARFEARAAGYQVEADIARLAEVELEIAAAQAGRPLPSGVGGRRYIDERRDDIRLRLANINAQIAAITGERIAAQMTLDTVEAEIDSYENFVPVASTDGVIWTASRQAGASVNAGLAVVELLDCERRFIELSLGERAFERIPIGAEARVRLSGSSGWFPATIEARHAAVGGIASVQNAAVEDVSKGSGMTVFLRMEPADVSDPDVAAAFCDVGRRAEIRIPRSGPSFLTNPLASLKTFFAADATEVTRLEAGAAE